MAHLWLYIQQGDLALLVDLLDGLDFGPEHVPLEAAVLQQLVPGDGLGHGFGGDEIVLLSVVLVLTLGPGGVCGERVKDFSQRTNGTNATLKGKAERRLTRCRIGEFIRVFGQECTFDMSPSYTGRT